MNYTAAKITTVVFCSCFMLGGFAMLVHTLIGEFELTELLVGGLFVGLSLVLMISKWRQLSLFESMTYRWYCYAFPDHIGQGGRVSCHACGGQRVQVRALLNHTYHREHFCAQCGKTLYYSPEQA